MLPKKTTKTISNFLHKIMHCKIIQHTVNGNATYLSDNSYLAIGEEATAGTAVIPSNFVPLISADVKTVVNHTADRRMKGIDWKSTGLLRGNRTHEGEIVILGDPDTLGHCLNMVMNKASTSGNGTDGYTHTFNVGAPSSYTFDIKKGQYVQRYFGVYVNEMKVEFVDGQMQITLSIMAMGQFSVATLGVALTGAGMTAITMDDEYDIAPNRGLVTNDVLAVGLTAGGYTNVTLTSVNANGIGVGFSSTSLTAAVGKSLYLVPQNPSFATLQDPFYLGNLLAGFGATASASATAAGSRSTATVLYDLVITIKNNLFAQNGSNRFDPAQILIGTKEAQVSCKQLFTDNLQRQAWQDRTKQAITLIFLGKFIKTDFTTQEKLTLTLNNVKLVTNDNGIKIGEYIMDDQSFEVNYDTGDSQAMQAVLVNRTASY